MSGRNFGTYGADALWEPNERAISINVSGVGCAIPARILVQGLQQVQCSLPPTLLVGYKTLQLAIAGQAAVLAADDPRSLLVVCAAGQYGHTGESCLSCPLGATCAGYVAGAGADILAASVAQNGSRGGGNPIAWLGDTEVRG